MKEYDFIGRAVEKHGNTYDYSFVEYKNSTTRVRIICKHHGEFWQFPSNHLRGSGCLKCSYEERIEVKRINKLLIRYKDIKQPEDYKLIPLTKGKFAKVDNEDFDMLRNIVWCTICTNKNKSYAYNDKLKHMHRFIMNPPDNMVVDHINGDGLDNRRCNLRVCTQQQNSFNSNNKGYYFNKHRGRWVSQITFNGIQINIGAFKTEEEAIRAYKSKSNELFGEYSFDNSRKAKKLTEQEVINLLFNK